MSDPEPSPDQPPVFNYILSFLLVGVAWGFTTPFIRRAAADFNARQEQHAQQQPQQPQPIPQNEADAEAEEQELQPRTPSRPDRNADSASASEDEDEDHPPPPATTTSSTTRPAWMQSHPNSSWLRTKIVTVFWTVVNLLRTPAYAIPLLINLTGSVWFFLLVGKHELSLTVPLANSSAFLFTVLGEWYVERKVIEKETWAGMALVLGGIAICVQSKT
ncbi:hypothetical protein FE257_006392 [Aspergillus nanangensis]|uniref:Integral membrane protein n=1 Tax=Aspergillus nanangensis TaxID=2582783 RepID=A0AAD4H0A6_ASPNN|nr:hypothetical protein FE257_006392 [Aspergillus nanangensis]